MYIVERFFSLCKYVLTDSRASLTPFMFESIVFLKANDEYWGPGDVARAIKMEDNQREQADYQAHQNAVDNNEE